MRWDYSLCSPGIRKRLKAVNDAETNEDVLATETRRACFTSLHALFSPWSNIYELLQSRSSTLCVLTASEDLSFKSSSLISQPNKTKQNKTVGLLMKISANEKKKVD